MGSNEASALTGCYLLVILGEPLCDSHKGKILQRVAKGLLSWNTEITQCDLKHLERVCEDLKNKQKSDETSLLLQHSTDKLAVEVLFNPQVFALRQCLRNLLLSPTGHKHIIHAGYSFTGSGSWILQDGVFRFQDFVDELSDPHVAKLLSHYPAGCSPKMHLHCAPIGDWVTNNLENQSFSHLLNLSLNPSDSPNGVPGASNLLEFIENSLEVLGKEEGLESSSLIGNIRFERPTMYIFPSGQGDCSLFGITGFTMLIDGGYTRFPCFWKFVRHIERLDSIMMTRINESNLWGILSLLRGKQESSMFLKIGYVFCNIGDKKTSDSNYGSKQENGGLASIQSDPKDLIISIIDVGNEIASRLKQIGCNPQQCLRETTPTPLTLYHKVGHGTLEMYILSPPRDSRLLKDFLSHWNSSRESLPVVRTRSACKSGGHSSQDIAIPISDVMSICCLIVWKPADPSDRITRILFPGSAPQSQIMEGLSSLKDLDLFSTRICTRSSIETQSRTKSTIKPSVKTDENTAPSSSSTRYRSVSPTTRKSRVSHTKQASTDLGDKGGDSSESQSSPVRKINLAMAKKMENKRAVRDTVKKKVGEEKHPSKNINEKRPKVRSSSTIRTSALEKTLTKQETSESSNDKSKQVKRQVRGKVNTTKVSTKETEKVNVKTETTDSEVTGIEFSETPNSDDRNEENHKHYSEDDIRDTCKGPEDASPRKLPFLEHLRDEVEPDSLESYEIHGNIGISKDSLEQSEDEVGTGDSRSTSRLEQTMSHEDDDDELKTCSSSIQPDLELQSNMISSLSSNMSEMTIISGEKNDDSASDLEVASITSRVESTRSAEVEEARRRSNDSSSHRTLQSELRDALSEGSVELPGSRKGSVAEKKKPSLSNIQVDISCCSVERIENISCVETKETRKDSVKEEQHSDSIERKSRSTELEEKNEIESVRQIEPSQSSTVIPPSSDIGIKTSSVDQTCNSEFEVAESKSNMATISTTISSSTSQPLDAPPQEAVDSGATTESAGERTGSEKVSASVEELTLEAHHDPELTTEMVSQNEHSLDHPKDEMTTSDGHSTPGLEQAMSREENDELNSRPSLIQADLESRSTILSSISSNMSETSTIPVDKSFALAEGTVELPGSRKGSIAEKKRPSFDNIQVDISSCSVERIENISCATVETKETRKDSVKVEQHLSGETAESHESQRKKSRDGTDDKKQDESKTSAAKSNVNNTNGEGDLQFSVYTSVDEETNFYLEDSDSLTQDGRALTSMSEKLIPDEANRTVELPVDVNDKSLELMKDEIDSECEEMLKSAEDSISNAFQSDHKSAGEKTRKKSSISELVSIPSTDNCEKEASKIEVEIRADHKNTENTPTVESAISETNNVQQELAVKMQSIPIESQKQDDISISPSDSKEAKAPVSSASNESAISEESRARQEPESTLSSTAIPSEQRDNSSISPSDSKEAKAPVSSAPNESSVVAERNVQQELAVAYHLECKSEESKSCMASISTGISSSTSQSLNALSQEAVGLRATVESTGERTGSENVFESVVPSSCLANDRLKMAGIVFPKVVREDITNKILEGDCESSDTTRNISVMDSVSKAETLFGASEQLYSAADSPSVLVRGSDRIAGQVLYEVPGEEEIIDSPDYEKKHVGLSHETKSFKEYPEVLHIPETLSPEDIRTAVVNEVESRKDLEETAASQEALPGLCCFPGSVEANKDKKEREEREESGESSKLAEGLGTSSVFQPLILTEEQMKDKEATLKEWGNPLGLPKPPNAPDGKLNRSTSQNRAKSSDRSESSRSFATRRLATDSSKPIYLDLAYIPHQGDRHYCNADYFKKIRARYYVLSGVNPSKEVLDALVEGKKSWEDKNSEITLIPSHESEALCLWMASNQKTLETLNIEVAPSASRCSVILQDQESTCSAYRVEF